MKKTASPLIIRPGHIRKLNSVSGGCKTESHIQKKKSLAFIYIVSAAKKVGSVFSSFFFRYKKADSKYSKDQACSNTSQCEAGESSRKFWPSSSPPPLSLSRDCINRIFCLSRFLE